VIHRHLFAAAWKLAVKLYGEGCYGARACVDAGVDSGNAERCKRRYGYASRRCGPHEAVDVPFLRGLEAQVARARTAKRTLYARRGVCEEVSKGHACMREATTGPLKYSEAAKRRG